LGLEALLQLFEEGLWRTGLMDRFADPVLELPACGQAMTWRYRGQVTPESGEVTTLVEITGLSEEEGGLLIAAVGALWVDDTPIYEFRGMAARLRERASP
ncbi:MAG: hypothetical protein MI723_01175, partial [Caulobacterales bacterium]|nr:hypothetical protein [Caulobacterales bacterium]